MSYELSTKSLKKLHGVHPDLVSIVERAIQITPVDFAVLEGLRPIARQKRLVESGASMTMKSRHLTGHAVDLGAWVDSQLAWDWPLYYEIAAAMKQAAQELRIPLEWGGDWSSFKDGPHFQLPWKGYPSDNEPTRQSTSGTG